MANLLDTLQEEGTFTTFTRAINTTGIVATLREPGAYIFRFSPRQGTAAARAARMKGQIKEEVKKARSERMLTLNEEDGRRFRQQFLGQTVQVLIEGYRQSYWEGLTDNYLRVEINGLPDHPGRDWRNTLVSAQLTHLVNDGVRGVFVEQSEDRFRS